ncbi:MAG: TonB-dependent receptor [Tannerellaceae bacterium]|nr:TonB-dependent receptor [Tannerellaceae bacterium]
MCFFPSVGLGWVASNEDFLKGHSFISRLKPHASYGVTGNSEIDAYQALGKIKQEKLVIGDQLKASAFMDNMPNPDLKWEKTKQFDIGVELGLFNNRLNFDVSYYYKYTTDLLLERPLPRTTGYDKIMDNIGEVSNQGVDMLITAYPVQTDDFLWSSTVNLSFNKNRVEKLDKNSAVDPVTGKRQILLDGFTSYEMVIREGEKLSSFYGYKRAGIYDGVPSNWDPETMNIPSVIGEKVTYKERQILGCGIPDWTGSFINNFNYKGFDLTLDFQFTWGVDVMQEYFHSAESRFYTSGLSKIYTDAWHPTLNPNGTSQAVRLSNFGQGNNAQADDTWVANGSYLRLNLIQLGYTFTPKQLQKMGLSSLRLYGSVNNVFLITSSDYKGYDPDNSSRLDDNNWGANRQFFTYPRPRTFTLGVNVAF